MPRFSALSAGLYLNPVRQPEVLQHLPDLFLKAGRQFRLDGYPKLDADHEILTTSELGDQFGAQLVPDLARYVADQAQGSLLCIGRRLGRRLPTGLWAGRRYLRRRR